MDMPDRGRSTIQHQVTEVAFIQGYPHLCGILWAPCPWRIAAAAACMKQAKRVQPSRGLWIRGGLQMGHAWQSLYALHLWRLLQPLNALRRMRTQVV